MAEIHFPTYNEFTLFSNDWPHDNHDRIISFLNLSVDVIYRHLDGGLIPEQDVHIIRAINPYPEMVPGNAINSIFLRAGDELWGNYAFEFGHELCHHIINIEQLRNPDPFGWVEEFFCELSGLFIMKEMAEDIEGNNKYSDWKKLNLDLGAFADTVYPTPAHLPHPAKSILENQENFKSRYYYRDVLGRTVSNIFSAHLLPVFQKDPQIWQCLQVLKNVKCQTTLTDFLGEWKGLLSDSLKIRFAAVENAFLGN